MLPCIDQYKRVDLRTVRKVSDKTNIQKLNSWRLKVCKFQIENYFSDTFPQF